MSMTTGWAKEAEKNLLVSNLQMTKEYISDKKAKSFKQ